MKRKDFLKTIGLSGAAAVLPAGVFARDNQVKGDPPACTLIPSETAGPFPLDLTANTFYFRKDVRENQAGVQLNLKMKIVGLSNCLAMQNVRVNIWHCNKDGIYSGYSQQNNQGQAGLTYLRGYQITDSNGEVEFITIFPGWYGGRTCHIHFQVHVSSAYSAVSQLTFEVAPKNAIYAAHPTLYTKGLDPLSPNGDNIFSDGYAYQLASLTPNAETGGYNAYLEVSVQGTGTVGVGHLEKEAAKRFILGQNIPNPYRDETLIPFTLKQSAEVRVDLWDLSGKKVATVLHEKLSSGDHTVDVNIRSLGLPAGNYVYQMEVLTADGLFKDCKVMTAGK